MPNRKKADKHEIPDLTDLESENIIIRKKEKGRRKPAFTEIEEEKKERQPENKELMQEKTPGTNGGMEFRNNRAGT